MGFASYIGKIETSNLQEEMEINDMGQISVARADQSATASLLSAVVMCDWKVIINFPPFLHSDCS
jgi:hypothetical protein